MFLSGQKIFVFKMLIKEYRIPLPMSVEEYRIAQLYMIQVSNVSAHVDERRLTQDFLWKSEVLLQN